ncbi:MAG TPA: CoA pyrophosphatase [Anaeromyxobacteraceae bacterium]|nr:CoA pyrophosphatase [Anaeromyxobacteraceae bacterium]
MERFSMDAVRQALAARPPRRLPERLAQSASVALVLNPADTGLEALFIERAKRHDDPWSGQIAFPGGRAEPGEDPVDTAVRETAEEVGLDLAGAELLGGLDEIQAVGRSRYVDLAIRPWVFGLRDRPGPLRYSDEVASAHWFSLRELVDPARQAPFPYVRQGTRLDLPSIRIGGLVIWGLTYRMLRSFADVVAGEP